MGLSLIGWRDGKLFITRNMVTGIISARSVLVTTRHNLHYAKDRRREIQMSSKLIKLDEKVYGDLQDFKWQGESFSSAVQRLLDLHKALMGFEPIIRGNKAYQEFQNARKKAAELTNP